MLEQHVELGRRRHGRLHRGAAHRGERLRRDARRRARPHRRLPREAGRPAGHAGPARPGAGQHGHLRVRARVPVRAAAPRRRRPAFEARFRQATSFPYLVKHGKAVAHRFTSSCVRGDNEREAYWRDVGTIDAYWEANIDLTDFVPALDLYDQRLADLDLRRDHAAGQVRPRRGRPPRHGDQLAGLGRLHHLGQPDRQVAAVHRRARPLLQRARRTWSRCPTCRSTAAPG